MRDPCRSYLHNACRLALVILAASLVVLRGHLPQMYTHTSQPVQRGCSDVKLNSLRMIRSGLAVISAGPVQPLALRPASPDKHRLDQPASRMVPAFPGLVPFIHLDVSALLLVE